MSRILIIVLFFPAIFANVPKVTLSHGGILVGNYTKTINGRPISAFKGIPYAQPPLGNLRFKSPQPFPAWQGERNAINESSVCFQVEAGIRGTTPAGQEDCLYLNVYVPTHVHRKKKPLPVMVWFHGGGWIYGSGGEEFGGPQYLLDKDVILVAGNYRLNIFGFLSSETLDCPGNFGLKDQAEILKWINKHIASFGGNPNSLTIFGESSGAVSVMYLMHSAQCNKLFHRAIAQSGTEFNTFGHPHRKGKAAERAMQLARQVNCDKNEGNWKEIIDCLREVPGDTLIRQFHKYYEWEFFPTIPLSAVIEENHPDAFITMDPRISPVPQNIALIVGFTSEEGAIYSAPILNSETMLRQLKENYTNLMPLMLYYDHLEKSRQDEVTSKIIEYYLKNGHDYSPDNFENFTQIITDGMFFVGFDQLVRRRVSQSSPKTYAYVFNHRGAKSITSILGGGSRYYGVSHADELQYIFTWDKILNITESNFRDEAMRDAMVELWTNFVIHGDPTPRGCKYHNWKSVDGFLWNYARIGSNNTEERRMIWNERELVKDRIDFWNSLRIF